MSYLHIAFFRGLHDQEWEQLLTSVTIKSLPDTRCSSSITLVSPVPSSPFLYDHALLLDSLRIIAPPHGEGGQMWDVPSLQH